MKFSEFDKKSKKVKSDAKEPVWVESFDFDVCHLVSEVRLKGGLTQKQLADLVGTKQPSIARVESGSVLPGLNFLKKIALAIGTTLIPPKFGFMETVDIEPISRSTTVQLSIQFYHYVISINSENLPAGTTAGSSSTALIKNRSDELLPIP